MNRTALVTRIGLPALLALVVMGGERVASDNTPATAVEKQQVPLQPAMEPAAGPTAEQRKVPSLLTTTNAEPAAYQIPWQSINAGGAPGTSTNYQLNGSVGQSAIGFVTSTNYQHGIGYWYGAGGEVCDCGTWGDLTGEGTVNPTDVVVIVNYVYKTIDNRVHPPNCPKETGDVDCSGAVNPADVVGYVNYVYKTIPWPCPDPCE